MADRLTEIRNRAGIYHESSDTRWLLERLENIRATFDALTADGPLTMGTRAHDALKAAIKDDA